MDKVKKRLQRKIRKDDSVLVIAGNNRGQTGKVFKVSGEKVYIQGVNLGKKHVKATRTAKGDIINIERPIHISNVKLMIGDVPVKLKTRVSDEGLRELYYKSGQEDVSYRALNSK